MSQFEFAEILGVSVETLGRWESGTEVPGKHQMEILTRLIPNTHNHLLPDDSPASVGLFDYFAEHEKKKQLSRIVASGIVITIFGLIVTLVLVAIALLEPIETSDGTGLAAYIELYAGYKVMLFVGIALIVAGMAVLLFGSRLSGSGIHDSSDR